MTNGEDVIKPTDINKSFKEGFDKGLIIGNIMADEAYKRVIQFFMNNNNKESYYNEIFRHVRGSKTTVSKVLQSLSNEYNILESEYIQIPQETPTKRMVSVHMYKISKEYYELFLKYCKN